MLNHRHRLVAMVVVAPAAIVFAGYAGATLTGPEAEGPIRGMTESETVASRQPIVGTASTSPRSGALEGATACRPVDVELFVRADRRQYRRNQPVAITVTAGNTGRSVCSIATGSCLPQVLITNRAGTEVWNRAATQVVCSFGQPRRLAPGAETSKTVTWNGRRCAGRTPERCPDGAVAAGRYRIAANWTARHVALTFVERA
jgi:hypothetical protein